MKNNTVSLTSDPLDAATKAGSIKKKFRRLKGTEVVTVGDFIADEQNRLQPWEGPGGFQADNFVRPIYRILSR
jgi:hypothetical protein